MCTVISTFYVLPFLFIGINLLLLVFSLVLSSFYSFACKKNTNSHNWHGEKRQSIETDNNILHFGPLMLTISRVSTAYIQTVFTYSCSRGFLFSVFQCDFPYVRYSFEILSTTTATAAAELERTATTTPPPPLPLKNYPRFYNVSCSPTGSAINFSVRFFFTLSVLFVYVCVNVFVRPYFNRYFNRFCLILNQVF